MIQLGNSDAIFASIESSTAPQHAGCLGIYAPTVSAAERLRFKDMLAWFASRLAELPNLRMQLVPVVGALDRYHRVVDDNFDLEFHVRHLSLPKPGDWRQLCIQVARLHSRPLDLSKPPWECHVIEGLEHFPDCPPNSFAIYFKIHYTLFGGDFGRSFMSSLHATAPGGWAGENMNRGGDTEPANRKYGAGMAAPLRRARLVGRSLFKPIRHTVPLARSLAGSFWGVGDTLWRIYRDQLPPLQRGPKCRFDEPVGPHRALEATTFAMLDCEAIAAAVEVTIHAVFIALIGGAMRRYLEFYQELPGDSIVAALPFCGGDRVSGSGRVELVAASLHTEISDPVERLSWVNDSLSQAKAYLGTPLADPLYLSGSIPVAIPRAGQTNHWVMRQPWGHRLAVGSGTVIASLSGPDGELYFSGAKLVRVYWLGTLAPDAGLFHTICHYRGRVSFGILADRDAMPDPEFYRECLEQSYAELKMAVLGRRRH